METRDWSLVVFTVLTQAAVGAFLVLQVLEHLAARRATFAGTRGLPVVLAVLSAGLFAALFHLSDPLQAVRAVVNFSSSWLSREIVFGSLFAALLSALVAQEWRAAGAAPASPAPERRGAGTAAAGAARATPMPARANPLSPAPANPVRGDSAPASPAPANRASAKPALAIWLPRFTAATGLAFLGCQTAIYLLPAQPAWNSLATPAEFGGTALRLGILGVATGLVARRLTMTGSALPGADDLMSSSGTLAATLRGLALAGIAALALEFIVAPLHLASLAANPLPAAAASVQRLTGDFGGILLLRLGLLGAAVAALVGVLVTIRRAGGPSGPSGHSPHPLASVLTCGAFGLTVASEVCGRFLFYAMQVRVGI